LSSLAITLRKQSKNLTVWEHRGPSDTLVVCFSGIGTDPEQSPPYEFARSATQTGQHNTLFIADPNRIWLNGAGLLEEICAEVEQMRAETGATRVVAAGHSMGGCSALTLPGFVKVDTVLAFAPQMSVHPEIVPDETRWMMYRDRIQDYRIRSIEDHLASATRYIVLHGRHGREAPQRDRFPRRDNLRHFILPHTHHNVPQRLKKEGVLDTGFDQAISHHPRRWRLTLEAKLRAYLRPAEDTATV
jgi:pimeloyl-ACP methyl ester carboxylesterase